MTYSARRLWAALLPLGLAAAALLPDPGALLPLNTYYFRDFSLGFYPLREFQASELAAGRLPFWNPYVHEGEFMLPSFYPTDLLHVINSSPEFVSWLLTLHLPLAALGAYALGRVRGMSRAAAFATGGAYSLGGFALSSLNLYTFLQALALAPWVLMAFDKASARGGRWVAGAALVLAVSLTTLAVEIVAQVVIFGVLLAFAREATLRGPAVPAARTAARLGAAVLLGAGLASVPIIVTLGILPETVRGAGFIAEEAGGLSLPPLALLQAVMPSLYMSFARPFETWRGGAIFVDGPPYFISIYVGVLVLSIAAAGVAGAPRRERVVLLALALFGAWYALGPGGGLWNLLHDLPLARSFRTPAKSLFATHMALAVLVGHGIDHLRAGRQWRWVAGLSGAGAVLLAGIGSLALGAGEPIAEWLRLDQRAQAEFAAAFPRDALLSAVIAGAATGLALAVARRRAQPGFAVVILIGMLVFDLGRAGVGVNRQVAPLFFRLVSEIAAEQLDRLDGGRVFVYPATRSQNFRAWLDARVPDGDLWAFYANRQQLDPYNNMLDRIETAASSDRTRFSPLLTEMGWTGYEPENVAKILPYLRHAAVSRVLSLDPLDHPDLQLRRAIPVARTGLAVHVYAVAKPWPRVLVACVARSAATRIEAARAPHQPGFDPYREVVFETSSLPAATRCTSGQARPVSVLPDREEYAVESDGPGWLVVRSTHAHGWHASIDGQPAALTRADGRHRAVPIPAGRHAVIMRYQPPWLLPAIGLTVLASILAMLLLASGSPGRRPR